MRKPLAYGLFASAALYAIVTAWAATANNGDLTYLESLYHHLFTLDRPWREFVFTEANFLFPDGFVYAPLRWVLGRQPLATAAYVVVSVLVTFTLIDRLHPHRDLLARASSLAFVAVALSLVRRLNLTLFWPNHHGALLPVALGLILLNPRRRAPLIGSAVVAALVTFSDGVSLMQVFGPLVLWRAYAREYRAAAWLSGGVLTGLGALAVVKSAGLMRLHTATLWPTAERVIYQFANLHHVVGEWAAETWVFGAVLGGAVALAWIVDRKVAWRPPAFFVIAGGVTVLTTLAMGRVLDVYAFRYLANCVYLAAIATALIAIPRLSARAPRVLAGGALLATLAGTGLAYARGFIFFRTELTDCVRRTLPGAGRRGVAGFWPAKFVTFTGGPTIDQIGPGFTKYLWMNAESWYRPGATFVITDDQVPGAVVRQWFGEPARVEACSATNEIYLYPSGLPEPATPIASP